jgi:hypothetical protein
MSKRFNNSLIAYSKEKIKELKPGKKKGKVEPSAGDVSQLGAAAGTETNGAGQSVPAAAEGSGSQGAGQTA